MIDARKAKIAGIAFFALLGIVNLVATAYYSAINGVDVVILLLCALPLLFSRQYKFLQAAGFLGLFIAMYMGFAALSFNANPAVTTTQSSFNMGYLFIAGCMLASVALIFGAARASKTARA